MFNLYSLPVFNRPRVVVWYQTPNTFRALSGIGVVEGVKKGFDFGLGISHKAICEAYVEDANFTDILEMIFMSMQAEVWGSNDPQSTNALLKAAGVAHTSMSVGDVVQIGSRYFACEMFGFKEIDAEGNLLPLEVLL